MREPFLDPADIPTGAHFDPAALQVPVALVLELRRER
jgi:malonyl-CoA O-methyltransferase